MNMSSYGIRFERRGAFFDIHEVAARLHCSPRHVRRLVERGQFPAPVKLGSLIRWPRSTVEDWIDEGCQPVQTVKEG
jgi:excisionase family DNA binding protein